MKVDTVGDEATGIIGRDEDLATIASLLLDDEVRLLSLTGPAGVGKTRLAREVGRRLASYFPQGVAFVDLAPVRDPVLVLPTIGRELGVLDSGGPPITARLRAYLSDRRLLLILDNLEQILPADVGIEGILSAAPEISLLVTSREPLHLLREQLYHVPPLALPDPRHLGPLDELAQIPSVALFVRRARMMDPAFQLTDANAAAVAELVVHLDGLPLAIKLAAARTQLLSPQMLLQRLDQRLSLLRWEAEDLPQRQHTLRGAITWSYDHLSSVDQDLFRALGVFSGTFTLEAVEAVAAQVVTQAIDVVHGLGSLVDKSLVQRNDDGFGGYCFYLLESVRDFALERLEETGNQDAAKLAHAQYYLALAERAEPHLTGPSQRAWFLRLEGMQDNFRAALTWWLDRDQGEPALRLAVALAHFWEIRGHLTEGRRWLEAGLARLAPEADSLLRARALIWLGAILTLSADGTGASARAESVLTDGMDLARTIGDAISIARGLLWLGVLSLQTGQWDEGKRFLQEAQSRWQDAGPAPESIQPVLSLGIIAYLQGRHDEAMRLLDEVLNQYGEVGDDWGRGVALLFLMTLIANRGESARAAAMAQEILALSTQAESSRLLYLASVGASWLARGSGRPEQVACLVGASEAMDQALGLVSNLLQHVHGAATKEALRARMEPQAFDTALRAGRRLSFTDVVALIEDVLEDAPEEDLQESARSSKRTGILLSPRESEVLQLVAEGLSNKQIAKELIVAESTVRYHLTSIFNKLGVDSRTHALAVAAQRGLIDLGSFP